MRAAAKADAEYRLTGCSRDRATHMMVCDRGDPSRINLGGTAGVKTLVLSR